MKRALLFTLASCLAILITYNSGLLDSAEAQGQVAPGRVNPNDKGFGFLIEFDDGQSGYFRSVSGIGSEHEVTEYREGTDGGREVVRKIPGRLKWNNITLKRGITSNMDAWEWRKMVVDSAFSKVEVNYMKSGSIFMVDRNKVPIAQWDFKNAWPSKISGPLPKADGNDVLPLEEVTIVHEYMERVR